MATYVPEKFLITTGLDEIGLRLGIQRFPDESLSLYRKRIELELRQPSGSAFIEFERSLSRQVGLFDKAVFDISLKVDEDGIPLAADPFIKITSNKMYLYHDYANGYYEYKIDFNQYPFLEDIANLLSSSSYFDVTNLADYSAYLKNDHLAYGDNLRLKSIKLPSSEVVDLNTTNIRSIKFSRADLFLIEESSVGAMESEGSYYVDYRNGIVWHVNSLGGEADINYTEFPYRIWWRSVKAFPLNDEDTNTIYFDSCIDEEGSEVYKVLTPKGAKVYNELLKRNSLEWG